MTVLNHPIYVFMNVDDLMAKFPIAFDHHRALLAFPSTHLDFLLNISPSSAYLSWLHDLAASRKLKISMVRLVWILPLLNPSHETR